MDILILKAFVYPLIIGIVVLLIYISFTIRKQKKALSNNVELNKKNKKKYFLKTVMVLLIPTLICSSVYLIAGHKYYDRNNNLYFSYTDVVLYDQNNNPYQLTECDDDLYYINSDGSQKVIWKNTFLTPGGYIVFINRDELEYIGSETYADEKGSIFYQTLYWPYWNKQGDLLIDCGDKYKVYTCDEQNEYCRVNNINLPNVGMK